MPHPALPPSSPPAVILPAIEKANHAKSLPVSAPESLSIQATRSEKSNSPVPPIPAEVAATEEGVSTAEFVNFAGESRADLLGDTVSTGYLQRSVPVPEATSTAPRNRPVGLATPDAVQADLIPQNRFNPLNKLPVRSELAAASSGETALVSTFYSVSGTNGALSSKREAELINGLSRAIAIDKLPEDLASPNLSINTNLRRLDILAQNQDDDPLNPFFLPVPSRPQSVNEDRGPVFSFPNTLPGGPRPEPPPPAAGTADTRRVVELTADRQEYDEQRKIFTAEGRVSMRYQGGVLDSDRLQVNLTNRIAVAEGNVAFTRGTQVLRGQRLEYNFVQGVGEMKNARGEILIPELSTDFATAVPSDVGAASALGRPVSDRLTSSQPTQNVSSPGGASVGIGVGRDVGRVPGALPRGGTVRRLRFEAEKINFTPEGWVATNIQITNDPFSPPQLILKANQATLTRLSPLRDELRASRPRLVFDNKVSLPIPLTRTIIDRGDRPPPLVQFGFDNQDRGGLFIQRPFTLISTDRIRFTLTPQIYIQRAIFDSDSLTSLDNFGAVARLNYRVGPRTSLRGFAALSSFDVNRVEDRLRASVRGRQLIGNHTLSLEYSYRDRLFNGSLGFQTVQSSIGALLVSPSIPLGDTGIALNYQAGFQFINSDTDRLDLLDSIRDNNRVNLGRFQASVGLRRGFLLWKGKPLPATPTEGLRYTPNPIVPYLSLGVGLTGVTGYYTNGDSQNNVIGSVALYGQFGHFSKRFFDYTGFSVTYIQLGGTGESPFLFDRTVDNRTLVAAITQQIYGPLRLTVQTSINLDTRREISTDYILEISRRAYGILFRYNPVLEIGSVSLRISDFNWTGGTEPFAGSDITPVEGGIRQESE